VLAGLKLHELAAQIGDGFEDSASDNAALKFGELVFDLVEPRIVSGCVMQQHVWMIGKEAPQAWFILRRKSRLEIRQIMPTRGVSKTGKKGG
jgi:hypothetical protein